MAKKKRLKEDAFSWVQDTKQSKEKSPQASKAAAPKKTSTEMTKKALTKRSVAGVQVAPTAPTEQTAIVRMRSAPAITMSAGEEGETQRVIFVKFINTTARFGQIVAILEFASGRELINLTPWSEIASGLGFGTPPLTSEDLMNATLEEIHTQYRVELRDPEGLVLVPITP